MFIETVCPGCQRKLRVSQDHAGQPARCPVCNTVYTVPDSNAVSPSADPGDRWRLKTPEGQEYGPVSRSILDGWVAEGRVNTDCYLRSEATGTWSRADDIYPVLRPAPIAKSWVSSPGAGGALETFGPATANARYVVNPDRGGIILAMGILSWAIGCPIFGVLAWVMGSSDLREMQAGQMDRRGQGLTNAGRLIGMLHVLLTIAVLVIGVGGLLVWGVFR